MKPINKKTEQLGMPHGTANGILRKSIIFNLLCKLEENYCFQCSGMIETVDELSIEHKIPFLDSEDPQDLFFNLNNIAFSHLSCNIAARRIKHSECGTSRSYKKGCRCDKCKEANKLRRRIDRRKK